VNQVRILPQGVLDLSSLTVGVPVANVFVFFARQFLKVSPHLVASLMRASWQQGSTELKLTVSSDGLLHVSKVTFSRPVSRTFEPEHDTLFLHKEAQRWVDSLPQEFAIQLAEDPQAQMRFLGFPLPPDTMEAINGVFSTLGRVKAEAGRAPGQDEAKAQQAG
jgi:hypothetical protein